MAKFSETFTIDSQLGHDQEIRAEVLARLVSAKMSD